MIALQTRRHNPVTYHRLNPWMSTGEYYWLSDNMIIQGKRYKKAGFHQDTTHLVSNNAFYPKFLTEVLRMRDKIGFKFVMDVDDYWYVDPWSPVAKELRGATLEARIETMKAADIITCTHSRLADHLKELNPTAEIHIIPNGLNPNDPQWEAQPVEDVSFGYIGGPTHKRDLKAMHNVQEKIDIYAPDYFKAHLKAKRTFSYTPQDRYGNLYNEFTVALAPIWQTKFTALKSDIKAVEAGFKNRMLVATDAHPYLDNPAIKLLSDRKGWLNLKSLSLAEVQDYASRLNEWATSERNLDKINEIRKQIIG